MVNPPRRKIAAAISFGLLIALFFFLFFEIMLQPTPLGIRDSRNARAQAGSPSQLPPTGARGIGEDGDNQNGVVSAFNPDHWKAPPTHSAEAIEKLDQAGNSYLHAFQLINSAEKLLDEGKRDEAVEKYKLSSTTLRSLSTQNPTFNPELVTFRLKEIQKTLDRIAEMEQ